MYVLFFMLVFSKPLVESLDLVNITDKAFGNTTGAFPTAFGDFNGDKLTDMIVLKSIPGDDTLTVRILLAKEPKVVGMDSRLDTLFHWGTREESLQCNFAKGSLTSAVPGDFDGDGGMDLLVTSIFTNEMYATLVWGEHTDTVHKLICPDDQQTSWAKKLPLQNEPLVFDYNYDYISDLFVVDADGKRIVYMFSSNRSATPERVEINSEQSDTLKRQHSNAHVDINGDGWPDLLLTTQTGLELFQRIGNHDVDTENGATKLKYHGHIAWPRQVTSAGCTPDKCVGQVVLADFDLTGSLDLIVPMCYDTDCQQSMMFIIPLGELWLAVDWSWRPAALDLGGLYFYPPAGESNPLQMMAPRLGDINLDGFPDLLMPLKNKSADPQTHLLLNAACSSPAKCTPFRRQFQLEPKFMEGAASSVVLATFFDLFEDGRPDIIAVSGRPDTGYHMAAYTNTSQDSDAYFIKVVVLSGRCFDNCENKSKNFVPYGTNMGGQLISYQSQRAGAQTFDSFKSVAVQLPQSAHFALQTPYTIFGLGLSPNFIDYLWVKVFNLTHDWPQIIPNSQLYIIPYPPNAADQWKAKISIIPSKNIVITGLAMIGTCLVTVLVILALHWRERRQDRQAKLQESNRFHFDAM